MGKEKIFSVFLMIVLVVISIPTSAMMLSEMKIKYDTNKNINNDILMLVRIPYSEDNQLFVESNNYEIVSYKPGEWFDITIINHDLNNLDENNINYSIQIDDIDRHCNNVRGEYHTFPEIEQILQDISDDHPSITDLVSIGTSYEDRDIWCLEISDNPGVDENEPGVFYIGLHHAREWPTVEICLYIANELTDNYGTDPDVTNMVNNRRLWIVPCENPDGYVYSHDMGHNMWRKNRRYFPEWNSYGVDPNRNYGGSCDGHPWGMWGSIGEGSQTHDPDDDTFCGPWSMSEDCTQSIKNFFINNDICASISWHTYSELVLWPWNYGTDVQTPDDSYLSQVGINIANLITQQDGTGTYLPQQGSGLYPTTGDTTDWAYGYSHYVLGRPTFCYTIEACTSFFPSEMYLDQVCEENYDGAFYLLEEAANINDIIPRVIPPVISEMDSDPDGTYTITWDEQNPDADPDYFQLDELSDLTVITDDAEAGSSLWNLDGFQLSTSRSHSSSHSYKSRYQNEDVSSMTTNYPVLVEEEMDLGFWCWYDIESNFDMGFVEVSTDGRQYTLLDTFTGSSSGWEYHEYPLDEWAGKSVYIRFRYTTDSYTLDEGFYVDDIYPVADFQTVNTLSSSIPSNSYTINNNPEGVYYYQVRGYNTEYEWGDFSILEDIEVTNPTNNPPISDFSYTPNDPTTDDTIMFSDESYDTDGTIISWLWDFGDGDTSIIQNPSHIYDNKGTYTVSLIVTDDDFDTDIKYMDIYVSNYGPNADFSFNPNIPQKEEIIYFTDESYDTSTAIIDTWYWEFGDGEISTDQNPSHSYDQNGSYIINLTVTNNQDFSDTTSKNIYVGLIGVDISLSPGWNLITIPVENNMWASDIAENLTGCVSISCWDPVLQTYDTYIVGGPPSFDFEIQDGRGYFIDMTNSDILTVSGAQITYIDISLKTGWNLIGWYHETSTSASSIAENITGCTSISCWDPALQTYNTYIVGGPPSFDFEVTCGIGMFVDVSTDSIWHGEG